MASYFDLKGTTIDSFKIGKGGPNLTRSGSNIIKVNSNQIITEEVEHPGYISNKYYTSTPLTDGFAAVSASTTLNTITYFPFRIPRYFRMVDGSLNVTTAVTSSLFRIGIYTTNSTSFLPDTLVDGIATSSSDLSGGTTGFRTTAWFSALYMYPGWYWLAIASNASISFTGETSYPAYNYFMGSDTLSTTAISYGYRNPSTWVAGSTFNTTAVIDSLTTFATGAPTLFFKAL
ncbi:hypothetical protein [Nostoc sp.]|uniref:hypothetical protein n=1 Tax=Nostoc sp. TaxID=1180 RepID=UPI002FF62A84